MKADRFAERMRRLAADKSAAPSPSMPADAKTCRICGTPWPKETWVMSIGVDFVRGYCCPEHCKEGGDWIR